MHVIVETAYAYGRAVLRGINDYVVAHEPWSISLDLRGLMVPPPRWLAHWNGDGVISQSSDGDMGQPPWPDCWSGGCPSST